MQRHIFFAIPTHDGRMQHETASSLVKATHTCQLLDIKWYLHFTSGCSLIPDARDILASEFLRGDWTDIVWLDTDISFEPEAFVRLVSHPVEMIAGIYRFKRDKEEYPVNCLSGSLQAIDPRSGQPSENGVFEVDHVPMGFCRMSRSVLERLAETRPRYRSDFVEAECWNFFDRAVVDGKSWGEDFEFCRRWRAIGGKVWVDPKMDLVHIGAKSFPGNLGIWLRNRMAPLTVEQKAAKWDETRAALLDPAVQESFRLAMGGHPKRETMALDADVFGIKRLWRWPKDDIDCWASLPQWKDTAALLSNCQERRVVVQAGGCCGVYPTLLAREFEKVITFEIDDTNFECLMSNCPEDNIFAYHHGLADYNGQSQVFLGPARNCGNNYLLHKGEGVRIITLDSLKLEVCDAIILDCEGGEDRVIEGARETIKRCMPALIVIETITDEMVKLLAGLGYVLAPRAGIDRHFVRAERLEEVA